MDFVQPTSWLLYGGGIHVNYLTAGPDLFYQNTNTNQSASFTGEEIRVVNEPDLGTLVSVTTLFTVRAP